MKGKLKIMSLLLACGVITSFITACSDGTANVPQSSTSTDPSSAASDSAAPGEAVELTWWHFGDAPKNPDKVIEALNEKSAKDIGVKIKFVWATGTDEKLKTALSTGASDDIAFTCSWFAYYPVTAQKNQLLDITEMVKTDTPALYNSLPEFAWKAAEVGGKIYAVPAYKDIASTYYWRVNKEYVLDGAGAEAEFKAAGQRVSSLTPLVKKVKEYAEAGHPYPHDRTAPYHTGKNGVNPRFTGTENIQNECSLSVKIGDPEHKVIWEYGEPDNVSDIRTINEWYKAGYINGDAEQIEEGSATEFIVVGCGQGWKGAEKAVWGANKDYTEEIQLRYGPVANTFSVLGSMNGIFANSKHPKEALKYLEYINTNTEYRNMLAYGVEGANWTDNNDGTVTKTNDDWSPSAFAQGTFMLLKPVSPAPASMYDDMKAEIDQVVPSDLMGFIANIESVKTEVAAIGNIGTKYQYELACGSSANIDATLQQFEKEIKAAGWEKVRDEVQRQVDEFIANNK